ncbi:MAG: Gfo/Idh/MocA family oxidoreductase [Gemmatimonadetes bacterium]|jgi:predicted dehydrogenase|nr:Gfo/Idh/MocA family oxidoreductase [Gemmatimonadota bacterium]MBT5145613.1 Gfo/Idh/MocA family oxidoreductase [Gemmatimonadota bacterium]MBT5588157.1 Gfo/Idh/MocA family oxidoreductase [Gemmatimonadota bacterium]MBT5960677.1 Gfo/Idh/MocA family oxidoreductase [Gemmatimonadota bacterium]MBT7454661.1 Gfo/Idh/MocA family oxidoreductase [Gemmatimonadota bacterium]
MTLRVGLIGAGGVGRKRAAAVREDPRTDLQVVCDRVEARAREVAAASSFAAAGKIAAAEPRILAAWEEVVASTDVDLIIVSTTHDMLATISTAALQAGKHVLCEKPLGRTVEEAQRATGAAAESGCVLHAGYNHRFHPAMQALHQIVGSGQLGDLLNLRGRYGHGGRPGYEREWRADASISGGGELLDQGAHLIDLSLWLLGAVEEVNGRVQTAFWDIAPVEDNAFALLTMTGGQTASLHVSWTQWRNLFSLELFGRDGYAQVEGLGGSYGEQRLTLGHRRAAGGAPEESSQVFAGVDRSWNAEWDAFVRAIDGESTLAAKGISAVETLDCIGAIYRSAATAGSPVSILTTGESA